MPEHCRAFDSARRRIAPRPARDDIAQHLQDQYGIVVTAVSEMDLGVYRVDRAAGDSWVARVFPAERPESAVAGDAEILRFLERHDFASERVPAPEPLSVLHGQPVLVTEYVPPVPRHERAATIREHGGLRRLGEILGRLHALPASGGALARPGGAWHHLTDGLPRDEISAAQALLADCQDRVPLAERKHYEMLRRELADADTGTGLPQALIHPDFVLANVIASAQRGPVLVDWTGAGRGPRAWSLAFLLFAEGARNPPRADLVVAGYRRQLSLEAEERRRLQAMMPVRAVVLAAWSFCLGRSSLPEAARTAAEARATAEVIGPRVVAALTAQR